MDVVPGPIVNITPLFVCLLQLGQAKEKRANGLRVQAEMYLFRMRK
jgi:hypothetical protein